MDMTTLNIVPLLPEIFLAISAMGLLIAGVCDTHKNTASIISLAGLISVFFAFLIALGTTNDADMNMINGAFKNNGFIFIAKSLVFSGMGFALVLSSQSMKNEGVARFEFPILIMLAGIGMLIMVASNSFLIFYMGLELQSLSLYILAAMRRGSIQSAEAGVKYFTLGALSSGFVLFGISMIYGFTGSIGFDGMAGTLDAFETIPLGVTFGLVFLMAGLGFKISAAPFHMWTPDVYQGAPTLVTAIFATLPKVAAIAILTRIVLEPFGPIFDQSQQILYALSILSMCVGSFGALMQTNIKRLLAYSSIGNMGYILIGLIAGTEQGVSGILIYLLIYIVMTAGVFSIILALRRNGNAIQTIDGLKGFSKIKPLSAYAMAIFMFSMSGIPPMAGFFGKLFVFQAAISSGHIILAVIGVVTSVVAAYYYLKIIKVMFFDEGEDNMPFDRGTTSISLKIVSWFSVLFALGFIFKTVWIVEVMQRAASTLF